MANEWGPSRNDLRAVWDRQIIGWHALFVVVVGVVTILVSVQSSQVGVRLAWIAAIVAAYVVAGSRALRSESPWPGVLYVLVAGAGYVGIVVARDDGIGILVGFVLFPHVWAFLERTWAIVANVVLAVGLFLAVSTHGQDEGPLNGVLSAGVTFSISMALGLFIDRMMAEAKTRAETIDELNATRAQLAAVERERGISDERERLSREIHDTLAQGFTSVLALTRAADAALGRGDVETARARLSLVESTAADNLKEARLIVAELTPGHLESRTLPQALDRLVATVRDTGGVDVSFDVTGTPVALGGAREVVLFRAAQEALANVRRHAAASRVQVRLAYAGPMTTLTVADDGVGFDPSAPGEGYGIDGLRARAVEVGGTLELASAPGAGTDLIVTLPLPAADGFEPPGDRPAHAPPGPAEQGVRAP